MLYNCIISKRDKRNSIPLNILGSVLHDSIGVCCATKCNGFNNAREDKGGAYSNEMVDGVISVLRLLPVFLLVIMYWAIYSQVYHYSSATI